MKSMKTEGKYSVHYIHSDGTLHSENHGKWRDVVIAIRGTFREQKAVRAVVYETTAKYGTNRVAEYSWNELIK